MTTQHITALSGTTIGVWSRGVGVDRPTVLLLGDTVIGWQDDPGRWAAELVELGHDVITVATPNWGNSDDMTAIDRAATQAATLGTDTSRLLIVARRAGAVAALNWALRHLAQVSRILLVSPIIDLEERWDRVTADRSSLQAAYGGSQGTFDAAMPTWNPAHLPHRPVLVQDLLSDRLTMWWAADDTDTPAATTAAIAALYGAETTGLLATEDPAVAPVDATLEPATIADLSWHGQRAATEAARWLAFQAATAAFRSADGSVSCVIPDGRTVWTWADTLGAGAVDADGTWSAGVTFSARNSLVVQAADGTITGKIWPAGGSSGPSLVAPADHFYWPQGIVVDDGALHISCELNADDPPPFGTRVAEHIITLALPGLTIVGDPVERDIVDGIKWGYRYEPDGPWVYDIGHNQPGPYYTFLARCARGQVSAGPRQYWAGSGWSADPSQAAALVGPAGPITGWGAIVRCSGRRWLLYSKEGLVPTMQVYAGPGPTGPWRPWALVHTPEDGASRYGGTAFSYAPQAHLQLSDDESIVLTWHTSTAAPTDPTDAQAALPPHFAAVPRP